MSKPSIDPAKYLRFYNFWLWQYTCRNPEYIQAYQDHKKARDHVVFKKLAKPGNKHMKSQRFETTKAFPRFRFFPKDPNDHRNSEEILGNALHEDLSWEIKDFSREVFEHFQLYVSEEEGFTYRIDLEKSLKLILAEVGYLHTLGTLPKPRSQDEYKKLKQKLRDCHFKVLRERIKNSLGGFKLDDKIRAIGLWLWDYKQIAAEERRERISIRIAAQVLYDKFSLHEHDYEPPEYASSSLRLFERLHQATTKCIKMREVLPMK